MVVWGSRCNLNISKCSEGHCSESWVPRSIEAASPIILIATRGFIQKSKSKINHTVDGRNPANQLRLADFSLYLQSFFTSQVLARCFAPTKSFLFQPPPFSAQTLGLSATSALRCRFLINKKHQAIKDFWDAPQIPAPILYSLIDIDIMYLAKIYTGILYTELTGDS